MCDKYCNKKKHLLGVDAKKQQPPTIIQFDTHDLSVAKCLKLNYIIHSHINLTRVLLLSEFSCRYKNVKERVRGSKFLGFCNMKFVARVFDTYPEKSQKGNNIIVGAYALWDKIIDLRIVGS